MKFYELTKEEEKLLSDYESGKYESIKNLQKEKALAQKIAKGNLDRKNI